MNFGVLGRRDGCIHLYVRSKQELTMWLCILSTYIIYPGVYVLGKMWDLRKNSLRRKTDLRSSTGFHLRKMVWGNEIVKIMCEHECNYVYKTKKTSVTKPPGPSQISSMPHPQGHTNVPSGNSRASKTPNTVRNRPRSEVRVVEEFSSTD